MPPPVLDACTEPLAADAPDLRGLWKAFAVEISGTPSPGALVLHPNDVGTSPITVTRHLEGDVLVWKFGPNRVTGMRRTD